MTVDNGVDGQIGSCPDRIDCGIEMTGDPRSPQAQHAACVLCMRVTGHEAGHKQQYRNDPKHAVLSDRQPAQSVTADLVRSRGHGHRATWFR